ncbi:MAG: hypothetical protein ICV63_07585 [Coleofasciculus sp. Co-bin14]|nr:hypothetical protein [Coleofasciculus sp. Co-bin14]
MAVKCAIAFCRVNSHQAIVQVSILKSCTFLKTITGGHCIPTIESAVQVLAGSAHPTCERFVESGARSEYAYSGSEKFGFA